MSLELADWTEKKHDWNIYSVCGDLDLCEF